MRPGRPRSRSALLAAFWAVILCVRSVLAQGADAATGEGIPTIDPAPALGGLAGKPIARIEIVTRGGQWARPVSLRRVRLGDSLSGEVARRALQELADSGRFAELDARAVPEGAGVVLRLLVTPRRIVAATKIVGGAVDDEETYRAAHLDVGREVTAADLTRMGTSIRELYVRRGYPRAVVEVEPVDTDDVMRVVVVVRVTPGAPRLVARRTLLVYPPPGERLAGLVGGYAVDRGDRVDEDALDAADRDLEAELARSGWHHATVAHRAAANGDAVPLVVEVQAGPEVRIVFEGNRRFDESDLTDALDLGGEDRSPAALAARVQKYYVDRGYLDARVTTDLRGAPGDVENVLRIRVRENDVVRVLAREYPCLTGDRSANEVGLEIDSFLSEALPGTGFLGAVDPRAVDAALGPKGTTGARVPPVETNPWRTYAADVYERATRHLEELYRSEGYLSATVGPVVLVRRACDRHSPAGECLPVGTRVRPAVQCPAEGELPRSTETPPTPCTPDPARGVRCEPDVVLHIPIKLGPRALLWDLAFEGNERLTDAELARIAEVQLGTPVSQVELEKSRRRVLDEYAERGYAFASVEQRLELSPDHTRAQALFVVHEREQVRVKDVVVRGARRTNEALVLGRVALERGDLYRRSDVRATEERLATLGVFSSVTVGLEDPEVFAREKVVVITVRERAPQYLDVRPGFSTGDGFRVTFEYGHRNLAERAIRLTLRVQLGLLPDFLILDNLVKQRFEQLPLQQRLERRDSISVELPEVGLGPLFPLGMDLIDVRDNSRDFGLTKDAAIGTLSYRPSSRFVAQVGGSLERNDATIFAGKNIASYLEQNPTQALRLRVPDGKTYAIAERTNVTWDRRDNPFDATSGTFVSGSVEHVFASPLDAAVDPVTGRQRPTSEFLRLTNRVAGYLRLAESGLSLALSFRWGYNVQLTPESKTYPDRLFFFGGVDSIRGFLQDSVIPQDLAERILSDAARAAAAPAGSDAAYFTPLQVPIRGGNVMVNPRAELRIPLGGPLQTAIFLDSGNLWYDPKTVHLGRLRYATGTGLRATTPVGPLALDIGMNLDRRAWEDPFAFHFSIGLF